MREVELQDVVEIVAGQSPKSKYYNEAGEGVPFFQGKTDFGDDYPTVTTWCTKPKKMAQKGDILFSVRAPVGPTNIANVDCCIGRGLSAIRPGEKIDRSFLRFYFKKVEQKISDRGRGSTFNAITQKDLKSLKVPLPTLEEQKAIVAKLDRAQRLIDIDKEMLTKYDELIQSVFLEMFGDPVTNPKGWEVKKLKDVCSKVTDGTHDTPDRIDYGIPLITGKNIRAFKIDFENTDFVSEEDHKKIYKRCNPEFGDVLYVNIGAGIGTAAFNNVQSEFSMKNVALLKPKKEKLDGRYLESCLNNEIMKEKLKYIASLGGAQKFLGLGDIRKLKIPVPNTELQGKFDSHYNKIEKEKTKTLESLKKSEELFSSLVQEAF